MKLLTCPLNGPRPLNEFAYGGEVRDMPDPASGSDQAWAEYLFSEDNRRGMVREWWRHIPSSYWFIAERDTATDEVRRTYPPAELYGERVDFDQPAGEGKDRG